MSNQYRAPESRHQIDQRKAYKDTRRMGEMFRDDIPKWDNAILIVFFCGVAPFLYPLLVWVSIPICLLVPFWAGRFRMNRSLPMKLPVELRKQIDYNDHKPGQANKFNKAGGTIMLGNLRKGNNELWIAGKDLLTHMLVIGTTGGGKTEALVSLSGCTSFCMGGGTIYVDAKAAPKLLFQFFTLARIFGREDDVRVIDYLTGNKQIPERSWERMSNTTNPFAQGTPSTASQTLIGLLPSGGGDNQYFLDRAIAILNALMPALVELRNMGVLNIYPSLLGKYISLAKFMELANNHIEIDGVHYSSVKLPERVLKVLQGFLKALPGFDPNKSSDKQPEEVSRQFGFAEGYFARTLASLAGTYGHIYETDLGEADFSDIVMNNRILIVMVPAMEQSGEERAALGKVVLSSIRTAMGQGLGGHAEGDYEDVIESLPVDLKIPTVIIVDEYAEVAVEGFAVTATQGRGLGMSVIFAGQDLAGFVRASQEEADMIFGNTRLKMLLALEDPEITWDRFKKLSGTMKVARGAGWEKDEEGLSIYKTNLSANIEDAERIDILDLKEQTEGQAHIFSGSDIHRAQVFYHGIQDNQLVKNVHLNRMLRIKNPAPDIIEVLQKKVLRNKMLEKHLAEPKKSEKLRINTLDLLAGINNYTDDSRWPLRFLSTLSLERTSESNDKEQGENTKANTNEFGESTSLSETIDSLNDVNSSQVYEETKVSSEVEPSHEVTGFEGMDVGLLTSEKQEDDNVQETIHTGTTTSSDRGLTDKITRTLSNAENHWIFKSPVDEDGLSKISNIYESMVGINTKTGLTETDSINLALDTIDSVTNAMDYPAEEIKPKTEDVDDLWSALSSLKEVD